MKRLVCEMCGGTNLIKQDGVYVCESCGTKYSVEEARKMLVEVEGTVDVSGSTVKIDRSGEMEQLRNLMIHAFDSSNYEEALSYATRILEIDSTDYLAHYVKGTSSGWQSTVANPRLQEAASCWATALRYVPLESKEAEDLVRRINHDLSSLGSAMMTMYFKSSLLETSTSGLTAAFNRFGNLNVLKATTVASLMIAYNQRLPEGEARKTSLAQRLSSEGGYVPLRIFKDQLSEKADSLYDTIQLFRGNSMSNSALAQIRAHMLWWISCTHVLSLDDQESGLDYCTAMYGKTSRVLTENLFDGSIAHSQDSDIRKARGRVREERDKKRMIERVLNQQEQKRISEAQKKERQERFDAYWAEHAEERTALESRKAQLMEERKPYFEKVDEVQHRMADLKKNQAPSVDNQKADVQQRLKELVSQRYALGVFQGKEKKRLDAEIAQLQSKLTTLDAMIEQQKIDAATADAQIRKLEEEIKPDNEKLKDLDRQIAEIDRELTMDR